MLERRSLLLVLLVGLVAGALPGGRATAEPVADGDEPVPKGHYVCQGVKVVAIDRVAGKGDLESDKLTGWIRFDVKPDFTLQPGTEGQPFKILNPVVGNKSRVTLDKPIQFKGREVAAGTNLLQFKHFDGKMLNIMMPELVPFAIHSVTIHSDFQIPADTYAVTFEWTTAEGKTFSDTAKVFIDVKLP